MSTGLLVVWHCWKRRPPAQWRAENRCRWPWPAESRWLHTAWYSTQPMEEHVEATNVQTDATRSDHELEKKKKKILLFCCHFKERTNIEQQCHYEVKQLKLLWQNVQSMILKLCLNKN